MDSSAGRASSKEDTASGSEGSSSLDHALLESLFYNEMMLMEASPSVLLSALAADGTPTTVDPSTVAEKALLQDFGVSSFPGGKPWSSAGRSSSQQPPAATGPPLAAGPPLAPMVPVVPGAVSSSTAVAAPTAPSVGAPEETMKLPAQASSNVSTTTHLSDSASTTASETEKRNKLVSQFATLASRLGISLPTELLQSLTAAAAPNSSNVTLEQALQLTTTPVAAAVSSGDAPASSKPPPPPQVQELQSTAEASIAAVSRRRSNDELYAANDNSGTNKQPYSKRRKKPRLSDCEHRLAQLETENALLKRHLHDVTEQSHKLNQEQRLAQEKIRELWKNNAGEEELDIFVKHFTEMYSDYGKRRQQELVFHLEQLER